MQLDGCLKNLCHPSLLTVLYTVRSKGPCRAFLILYVDFTKLLITNKFVELLDLSRKEFVKSEDAPTLSMFAQPFFCQPIL